MQMKMTKVPSLVIKETLNGVFKIWSIFVRELAQVLAIGRSEGNLSMESCTWGGGSYSK